MAFIGNTVQTQGFTPAVDYFSGNGSTVTFTLSRPVAAAVQVEAVIDNVVQNPSTAYTVSGNAITFTSAPLSGSNNIYVRYTSLITTYNGISQSPSVIGDLTASGGYLSTGSFNNSFVDGTIVDYVTGNGRITVGSADGFTLYTGGTSGRTALASWTSGGVLTNTGDASISGLTVGKGGGSVGSNSVVGYQALNSNTTGSNGLAIGYQALYSNTTYRYNHAVGYQAGYNANGGEFNNFFGWNAGYGTAGSFTGGSNCGFGLQSCYSLSSGTKNVGYGNYTFNSTTTGSYNTAVGDSALYNNTTASNNTAVGYQAGYTLTTSGQNTYVGYQAGYLGTSGPNTYIGYQSGNAMTTGYYNTILGSFSGNQGGLDIRTSTNYIVLSDGAGNPRAYWDGSGNRYAPTSAYNEYLGQTASYFALGNSDLSSAIQMNGATRATNPNVVYVTANTNGVYLAKNGTSWTANSDERLKDIIEPITNGAEKVASLRAVIGKYKTDEEGTRRSFLIAQDVQKVLPEAVNNHTLKDDESGTEYLGVQYTDIIPLLVAAITELNAKVTALEAKLEAK